jgi:hypothetical protein
MHASSAARWSDTATTAQRLQIPLAAQPTARKQSATTYANDASTTDRFYHGGRENTWLF